MVIDLERKRFFCFDFNCHFKNKIYFISSNIVQLPNTQDELVSNIIG